MLKIRKTALLLKALEESGEFSGYGSTFGGEPDVYGDIIAEGAFKESLQEHKSNGTMPAMLYGHSHLKEIGEYTDIHEDKKGLYVEGRLWIDGDHPDPDAMKAYRGMKKQNSKMGLSIGYDVKEFVRNEEDDTWTLTKIDLWEVSPVVFPANENARVEAVKSALARGTEVDPRHFEKFLRDVGLSHVQAKRLMADGFSGAFLRDVEADQEIKSRLQTLVNTIGG